MFGLERLGQERHCKRKKKNWSHGKHPAKERFVRCPSIFQEEWVYRLQEREGSSWVNWTEQVYDHKQECEEIPLMVGGHVEPRQVVGASEVENRSESSVVIPKEGSKDDCKRDERKSRQLYALLGKERTASEYIIFEYCEGEKAGEDELGPASKRKRHADRSEEQMTS